MVEKIGLAATMDMSGWSKNVDQYNRDVEGMSGNTEKSAGRMQAIGAGLQKVGGDITGVGKNLTMGVTAPIVGLGTAAAKMAGDFEAQMNILTVAARSSGTSLDDLSKAALSVGADTELVGITAAQSADAMTSLYKAGFDTAEIFGGAGGLNSYLNENASLTGALRSSIDLAAASELDLAAATDVTIIAMKTFGLDADEASRVANSFVRTADASVASVSDLTAAMANIGPTAATFGMSLETTNTALGILSSRGIAGAEAGTALKSMLTNMMRQTPDVIGAWQQLGIAMYDAEGRMRAMPDILADLSSALTVGNTLTSERAVLTEKEMEKLDKLEKKRAELAAKDLAIRSGELLGNATLKEREAELKKIDKALQTTVFEMEGLKEKEGQMVTVTTKVTEEFRNQTVQTLAGTYGMKAMNTLLAEGAAGWQAMEAAVGAAASVEESAAARTTGFNAAMEQLGGALETIAIKAGGPLITALTNLLQGPVSGLLDKISNLNPAVWDWALKIGLVVAAVGPLLLILGTLLSTVGSAITIIGALTPVFAAVGAAIGAIAAPVLLIGGAIALLTVAWIKDWGGIRTFMTAFYDKTLKPILENIVKWFGDNIPKAISTLSNFWTNTLLPAMQAVGNWITGTLIPIFQQIWEWLSAKITAAITTVSGFWTNTLLPAIQAVANFFTGTLFPLLAAIVDVYFAAMSLVLTAVAGLWQNVLLPAIIAVGEYLAGPIISVFTTVSAFVTDTLVPALTTLVSWLGEKLQPVIEAMAKWITDTLVPALQSFAGILDGALKTALTWLHDKLLVPVRTALGTLGDKIQDVTKFFQGLADKLNGLKDKLPDWLTPGSPTPLEIGIEGIAEALTKVIPLIEDMAAALVAVSDSAPTTANMPGWMAGFKQMIEAMVGMLGSLYDVPGGPKANAINLAKNLAKELSGVVAIISDSAQALISLAEIDIATLSMEKLGGFVAVVHEILLQIVAEAKKWGETEAAIKSLFGPARKMVDQILDIVRIIEPATAAMTALAAATLEDMQTAAYKWSWVITATLVICDNLAAIAANLDTSGYPAAATAAEAINQIIVLVEPAVSAITALAGTVLDEIDKAAYKWSWVITGVMVICNNLALIAEQMDMTGYAAAEKFAESAGKILPIVQSGIDAIAAMATYKPTEGLSGMLDIDNPDNIFSQLDQLLSGLRWYAGQWGETAEEIAAKFAALEALVGPVVEGMGLIKPVIDAIAAMSTYAPAADLARMLDIDNPDNIFSQLDQILAGLRWYAGQWGASAEEVASKFAALKAFVGPVVEGLGLIKPVIDAVAAIANYEAAKGLPMKILAFGDDLNTILVGLRIISDLWVTALEDGTFDATALEAIGAFSTNVQTAIGFIVPTIDAIKALAEYTAAKGLGKAVAAFKLDLGAAITALGELATNPALSPEILTTLGSFTTALLVVIGDLQAAVEALGTIAGYEKGKAVKAVQSLTEDVNSMAIYLWNMQNTLEGDMGVGAATRIETAATSIHDALSRAYEKLGIVAGQGIDTGGFATAIASGLSKIKNAAQSLRDSWVGNWADITAAVNNASNAVDRFNRKLGDVEVPEVLEGHSPPPLANWLGAVADAARRAKEQLGSMAGQLVNYATPAQMATAQAAAMVANNNVAVNMGGVNINNGMDQALFEARVRRVVREAVRA